MNDDLRFVFDTNVVVSAALLRLSVARRAFDRGRARGQLLASIDTIHELNDVLRRPAFGKYVSDEERLDFLTILLRETTLVDITREVTVCRDPKDNKFLELALSGHATCIISGDRDLLTLHPFRRIPIVTPREFLKDAWISG